MIEPILISITKEDLTEIMIESLENENDMFILNFKDYNKEEIINKIRNISEILINEQKTTSIIFKNINNNIINSREFLTLYDYSLVLNIKLFKLN